MSRVFCLADIIMLTETLVEFGVDISLCIYSCFKNISLSIRYFLDLSWDCTKFVSRQINMHSGVTLTCFYC